MRVVVLGGDGRAVAEEVRRRRALAERVAGFVTRPGDPKGEALARDMGAEMLGGVDRVVVVGR